MTQRNVYATLAEFKNQQVITSVDTVDDGTIENLLARASRYIDGKTQREFYPSIETQYYDIPRDGDKLFVNDLCAVVTLTNGDGSVIPSTAYRLYDRNQTPYYALSLLSSSGVAWTLDAAGESQQVIALKGLFTFRADYDEAWRLTGAVLTTAITNVAASTFACTTGKLTAGMIVKIDDEIMIVNSLAASTVDTITPYARGDNGSTAATHLVSAPVYQWIAQEEISQATIDIAMSKYKRLYGDGATGTAVITAAGVVITPADVPDMAQDIIKLYARRL